MPRQTNQVTVQLSLRSMRVVCGICDQFVAHGKPEAIEQALELPGFLDPPGCSVHGQENLVADESASEVVLKQEAQLGA